MRTESRYALLILAFLLSVLFFIGPASAEFVISTEYGDGWQKICYDDEEWLSQRCAFSNYLTYPTYNGSYVPKPINYMLLNGGTNYDMFWNGGLLRLMWDGTYAYDMVSDQNYTTVSPWAFWKVESLRTTGQPEWQEEIPVSNSFIKIDNSTIKRVMVLGSGGRFNITYHNEGTRIKQDLELTAGYNRKYQLTYRIDSVAAQDVVNTTKKFTPGFFNNFTLYDVTDVPEYRVNRTFNITTGNWTGNGSYISGFNTSASIDNTNRRMYFTIENGQVMSVGQKIYIDPSWTVGVGGNAWTGNSTKYNTTLNRDTNRIFLQNTVSNYISKWRFDGSSGVTAYDENLTSNNNGTLVGGVAWNTSGRFDNAVYFDGVNDYVDLTPSLSKLNFVAPSTISFWIKTTDDTKEQEIISFSQGSGDWSNFFAIAISEWTNSLSNELICVGSTVAPGGDVCYVTTSRSELFDGNWHHIAIVSSGSAWNIYLDGNNKALTIPPGSANTGKYGIVTSADNFRIGNMVDLNSNIDHYHGQLDNIQIYNCVLTNDQINQTRNNTMVTSGNLTTWYNAGTGNETYQIDVNATTPTNSNYTVWYANNGTGSYTQLGGTLTGNNSLTISGTKYQNTDIQVRLAGNTTSTPELIKVTFWTQVSGGGTLYERTADISMTVTAGTDRALYAFRTADIPISVTANTDRQLAALRNAAQVFTIADSASATFIDVGELFERFAVQAISITDSISKMQTHVRLVEQAFSITDSAQRILFAQRGVQQAITIADSASRTLIANRAVQQAVSITDSVSRTYTAAGTLFIRYAEVTITVADSVVRDFWAGVYYTVSGYVTNALAFPLESARIDQVGGNYSFTDAAGYYSIVVPAGDRDILGRAIGYENLTKSISVSGNTALNMTLPEFRPPDYTSLIESVLGIVVVLMALIIVAVKRKKKKQTNINKKNGDNEVW